MKQLFAFLFLCVSQFVMAQTKPLNTLLKNYLNLKNELVGGNAVSTTKMASAFNASLEATNAKSMDEATWKLYAPIKEKLVTSVQALLKEQTIAKQRELFADLSEQMIQLAKTTSLSDVELYIDYCPMKKASWLSAEKTIRNPYYGNMMLTCGSVKETIKQ